MFHPVFIPRLYRAIADQIIQKILQGEYQSGDRLPSERDMAEMLSVSRATIREAIIALEIEGYVEVKVGSGIFIRQRSNKSTSNSFSFFSNKSLPEVSPFEILEVRLMLEPESAALAAIHATPEHIKNLYEICIELSTQSDPAESDRRFHIQIAHASGHSVLASNIEYLWELTKNNTMYERMGNFFVTQKVWGMAHQEHNTIFQAIAGRDPDRARQAMHEHLTSILKRLKEDFIQ